MTATTAHNHRFDDDGTCERCGKDRDTVYAERAAHAEARRPRVLSEGEQYAMDRQRQIVNESRRERRWLYGAR